MFLAWLKQRRRRRILTTPFPPRWLTILEENVPYYRFLSQPEQARLRDDLRIFITEKTWEGCGELEVSDAMKVTVAALACLLVLGMRPYYFERVQSILLYPEGFTVPNREALAAGVVLEGEAELEGQAHYRGPVILSWAELLDDVHHPGRGRNLVIHEFTHQLDMLNGAADGTPPLADEKQARSWQKVMSSEFNRLRDKADEGLPSLLDDYGAEDEAEFFAVASECFFDRPMDLRRQHRRLYDVLRDYYRQDPATWRDRI
jgi:Mlc titration factor MtfA (ptsG expression regulator)